MSYTRETYPFTYGSPYTGVERPEVWPAVDVMALLCKPTYFTPDDGRAIIAHQVFQAESSLRPLVRGKTIWTPGNAIHLSHAIGMFQLMRAYHVEAEVFPGMLPITEAQCLDPHAAWPRAWAIMNKNRPDGYHYNMTWWSAYTSGAYQRREYRDIAIKANADYLAGLTT